MRMHYVVNDQNEVQFAHKEVARCLEWCRDMGHLRLQLIASNIGCALDLERDSFKADPDRQSVETFDPAKGTRNHG
jgi:hypothetical protein